MRSYEAARGYFSFLSFVSWVAIIGGGILAVTAMVAVGQINPNASPAAFFFTAVPGLTLAAVGFFGLVFVQSSRAAVDSAEYGQQALQISRNQLEVSKQLLKLAEQRDTAGGYAEATKASDLQNISFDTDEPANTPVASAAAAITHEYAGHVIEEKHGKFLFDGQFFDTRMEATMAVDRFKKTAIEAS